LRGADGEAWNVPPDLIGRNEFAWVPGGKSAIDFPDISTGSPAPKAA